jgi:DUF4097 and DUF4098 domain-containing protein YvlB
MSLNRLSASALALVAAAVVSACGFPGGPLVARDILEETRPLDADGRFELENINGTVTLTTWSRNEVRIEAERAAISEEALERIEVAIDGEGDAVRVKTRYGKRKAWFPGNSLGKVDYTITLPAGASARVQTVNGPVTVDGLTGNLEVQSVNGPLELNGLGGEVKGQTVNGPIHARFDKVPSDGHHSFNTVNGGIEITLPEGTAGRLEATTVTGSIACDLPLDVKTKKKRHLEGRLGPGGGSFELSTVNGGINVEQSLGSPPAEAS